jgi:hypothetical protein
VVMCLVTTAFAPHNNNFERGGRAYKVDCVQIGGMVSRLRKIHTAESTEMMGRTIIPRTLTIFCDGRVKNTLRAGRSGGVMKGQSEHQSGPC